MGDPGTATTRERPLIDAAQQVAFGPGLLLFGFHDNGFCCLGLDSISNWNRMHPKDNKSFVNSACFPKKPYFFPTNRPCGRSRRCRKPSSEPFRALQVRGAGGARGQKTGRDVVFTAVMYYLCAHIL